MAIRVGSFNPIARGNMIATEIEMTSESVK
jgi:hypothetical protein